MSRAQVIERRARAVALVGSGWSYDQIAAELGYANRSGAWKAVQSALGSQVAESVDELRALEVGRLDALQAAMWEKAMAGDVAAGGLVLRIIEQRTRLLGLQSSPGKPSGKPGAPTGVVDASFWEHAKAHHPDDWTACRCPEVFGEPTPPTTP